MGLLTRIRDGYGTEYWAGSPSRKFRRLNHAINCVEGLGRPNVPVIKVRGGKRLGVVYVAKGPDEFYDDNEATGQHERSTRLRSS